VEDVSTLAHRVRSAYVGLEARRTAKREAGFDQGALPRMAASNIDAGLLDAADSLRRLGPSALRDHALATGSPVLRDVLALRATRGAADWSRLRSLLIQGQTSELTLAPGGLVSVLRVARTHARDEVDVRAVRLGAVVADDRRRVGTLDAAARRMLIELLLEAGERHRARRLLGPRFARGAGARLILLDLDNPFTGTGGDAFRWRQGFATLHSAHGLAPLSIDDEPGVDEMSATEPFDRVRCAAPAAQTMAGPLVSIVLAVRDPGALLITAVDSIVAQSYVNWQLLIIDDGSGPNADAALAAAVARDPRIRLVRHADSRGPYVRRNEALDEVTGEYVTFHDGDDWSHPQRIERQLAPLLGPNPPIATVSASLRLTDELRTVHGRGRSVRITESSIMVNRVRAIESIGYFDTVRRAADSGYRLRLAALGEVRVVDPTVALSLVRFRESTLSGTDLRDGYTHPARVAYSDAHAHWLEGHVRHGSPARLDFPSERRAFPAHPHIIDGSPGSHVVDALIIADARSLATERMQHRLTGMLAAAEARGATLGLLHAAEPIARSAAGPFSTAVREARARGTLVDVVPADTVTTNRAIALSTASALALGAELEGFATELVLVVDSHDPVDIAQGAAAEGALHRALATPASAVRRISPDDLAAELGA
jgi:glycosyltransferase involved in cell wall biosynthesis